MRKEIINSEDLEDVTGGEVVMSKSLNRVGFNTTGEVFKIKGDFKTMRNRLLSLYDANPTMGEAEFDQLVKHEFQSKGWI